MGRVAWLLLGLVLGAAGYPQQPSERTNTVNSRRVVGEASNAFSTDLYQAIKSRPGNLVVSPLSASAVLALVLQGAGGSTAQQLLQTMHLPEDQAVVQSGYAAFFDSLRSSSQAIVRIANKVYIASGSQLKPPFKQTAIQVFSADAEELDFVNHNKESLRAINQWVEQITDSKIKNLLDSLDQSTLMVLVNAIYFKGTWAKTFDPRDTQNRTFHTTRSKQVQVPTMSQTDYFQIGSIPGVNARVIKLPYRGDALDMFIILPDEIDGLPAVEDKLNQINFKELSQNLQRKEVILSLPIFKIETTHQLHEVLPNMGIRDLFIPGACNLTGITDQQVVVSKVVQKAFIEVNEEGTVAAAATAVVIRTESAGPPPVVYNVDRPFIFYLRNSDGNILFVGRIMEF